MNKASTNTSIVYLGAVWTATGLILITASGLAAIPIRAFWRDRVAAEERRRRDDLVLETFSRQLREIRSIPPASSLERMPCPELGPVSRVVGIELERLVGLQAGRPRRSFFGLTSDEVNAVERHRLNEGSSIADSLRWIHFVVVYVPERRRGPVPADGAYGKTTSDGTRIRVNPGVWEGWQLLFALRGGSLLCAAPFQFAGDDWTLYGSLNYGNHHFMISFKESAQMDMEARGREAAREQLALLSPRLRLDQHDLQGTEFR
jgi:hypothetical protein